MDGDGEIVEEIMVAADEEVGEDTAGEAAAPEEAAAPGRATSKCHSISRVDKAL